jgi:hypothetical protein
MYVQNKTRARSQKIVSTQTSKSQPSFDNCSYYQMQEMTDEAIQRPYWACRRHSGFLGDISVWSSQTAARRTKSPSGAHVDAMALALPEVN